MAGKKVLKHTHRLKKHTHSNGEAVYFCTLGECEFKINVALALGKPFLCWRCGKPSILNEYALRLVKPHCLDCKKTKDKIVLEDILHQVVDSPEPNYPARAIAEDRHIPSTDDLINRLRKTIDHSDMRPESSVSEDPEDLI